MLSSVLGLFSQDVAVDLGTSNTRVYVRGMGVVCQEPTVVAVHTDSKGRRKMLAVGREALPMLGRTPSDIRTVQPVRETQIKDYEVAEALLLHLIRRAHGRNGWISPRMVVTIPHSASEMERRAVRESCEGAGGREIHLVARPLAAAIGAGLPVDEPSGHMVVDIGGGSTEVSIVSLHGVVLSRSVPGGGEAMDDAIIAWLREEHDLLVGRPTAERIKIQIGTAVTPDLGPTAHVSGRCLRRGIPRSVEVSSADIRDALRPSLYHIGRGIREVLENAPPELASDVVDHGAVITGGGSQLRRIDLALRDATGLAVVVADDAADVVVQGAGRMLEELPLLRAVAS